MTARFGMAVAATAAMVVAGFATMLWASTRADGAANATEQAPYVVSGGLLGLALVAAGSLLAHVLIARQVAQRHDAAVAEVVATCLD